MITTQEAIAFLAGAKPAIEQDRLTRGELKSHGAFTVDAARLPDIDLSVVTYNSGNWLQPFFASLAAQDYPLGKIHLILTDHSEEPAAAEALAQAVEPIRARFATVNIMQQANRGFGAGHNRALHVGTSDYMLVSNIDLSFELDTITRLIAGARASPADIAAWECRQKPYEHPKAYNPVTQETPWVSGACLLLRRSALADIEGFDAKFFMYGEDVDLSGRLRGAGWKLRYMPQAVVWHYSYDAPGAVKETQYFHGAIGNAYLRLRYGNPIDWLGGIALQLYLVVHRQRFTRKHLKLVQSYRRIFANSWHFLSTRQKRLFVFQGWDYAPQRDGAFVGGAVLGTDEPRASPLVSIIVRTYPGRLPLLMEALRSLELQTYRPLEVIVVEDGGTTAAAHCVALQAHSDLDVAYYSAPQKGRCHTGNIGLELARGNFIGFLDDDDLLFADHVETLVGELLRGRAQVAYAYAWDVETSFPDEGGWVPYKEKPPRAHLTQRFDRARLWQENYIPIQAVLFDRLLYQTYGGFAEDLDNLEDWDLWQRFALAGDFATVEKTTSIYRTPANVKARAARMALIHDHYARLIERQALMPYCSTVGELRRISGGDDVLRCNRLAEKIAQYPVIYRLGRWLKNMVRTQG